ncbi:hypothetical protein NIES30_10875 [Phormidium tenue NIES-30]|uniref:Uncharacterized protein n=1 Tax=Phormidium tenue NIES-30 TaxID=549789 RepID=A0A1U7J5G4_9CYAN|nr:hypothetical protein NIES30_10875 [Phormidium tenue NIES-30]
MLKPIIDRKEKARSIRSPGCRGATLLIKTREGQDLSIEYSLISALMVALMQCWLTSIVKF